MKKQKYPIFLIMVCVIFLICGILMTYFSFYDLSSTELTNTSEINGVFNHYYEGKNNYDFSKIYLDDGTYYNITSPISRSFNETDFIKDTKKGDEIKLIIDLDSTNRHIIMIQTSKKIYLSLDDSENSLQSNNIMGIVLGLVITFASIGLIIFMLKNIKINCPGLYGQHKSP